MGNQGSFYAHTLPDRPPTDWEPLEVHLREVEELAGEFASPFNAAQWGEVLGRWHDLGKYALCFQQKLHDANGTEAHIEGERGRVNHSAAGAQHAAKTIPQLGRLLAYVIAAHHSGLSGPSSLAARLDEDSHDWHQHAPPGLLEAPTFRLPPLDIQHGCGKRVAFQFAFFTRMLLSCLVDADRLKTERFCDPEKATDRTPSPSIESLAAELDAYLTQLSKMARPTLVNSYRRVVLDACRTRAGAPPGFFSLMVPTGGGKTLASLDFALRHARQHNLRRVVVAIPFTSIIEQTAEVYRNVFKELGDRAVLEHHSNLDPTKETRQNQLASENWDAPLVVTTSVQLFEALFASRTTPCRKLHRLARSVIILDEVQTLPVDLLRPCLEALRTLVSDYGCSVVLCTATQPALEWREDFSIGIQNIRPIVTDPDQLYVAMRRVAVQNLGSMDDDQLLGHLQPHPSWLTIVNTRRHAADLHQQVGLRTGSEGLYHLSTYMCGQHRSEIIQQIRKRLAKEQPCRVVSTQLIEAGVDVDFPVVLRALSGVDSIAQAAGRCNREGRLNGLGTLYLFDPSGVQPKGDLGAMAAITRELLPDHPDPLELPAVRRYFELRYYKRRGDHAWDDRKVMECFPEERGRFMYDFKTATERFYFIDDNAQSVFVPYGAGERLIERLRRHGPSRTLLRRLQRYTVSLPEWAYQPLIAAGDIDREYLAQHGYSILINPSIYDAERGLLVDRPGFLDAHRSVI